MRVSAVLALIGAIMVLAGCAGTPAQAQAPAPLALVWRPVGDGPGGNEHYSTACTPWGDRLYQVSFNGSQNTEVSIAVLPADHGANCSTLTQRAEPPR